MLHFPARADSDRLFGKRRRHRGNNLFHLVHGLPELRIKTGRNFHSIGTASRQLTSLP